MYVICRQNRLSFWHSTESTFASSLCFADYSWRLEDAKTRLVDILSNTGRYLFFSFESVICACSLQKRNGTAVKQLCGCLYQISKCVSGKSGTADSQRAALHNFSTAKVHGITIIVASCTLSQSLAISTYSPSLTTIQGVYTTNNNRFLANDFHLHLCTLQDLNTSLELVNLSVSAFRVTQAFHLCYGGLWLISGVGVRFFYSPSWSMLGLVLV